MENGQGTKSLSRAEASPDSACREASSGAERVPLPPDPAWLGRIKGGLHEVESLSPLFLGSRQKPLV